MATLPPGWAADYDGQRWFFCYTATNHTQYHFPTPGDEFPDFSLVGGPSSGASELLPEERLESERQVRKRGTGEPGRRKACIERSRMVDGREDEVDEGGFSFDSFGYLGPGSDDEIGSSKVIVEDGERGLAKRRPSVGAVSSLTSTETGTGTGLGATTSTGEPVTRNYTIIGEETSVGVELPSAPARLNHRSSPHTAKVPLLDSREIAPSPVGFIAELVSESTARCEEEINSPPVELPDTGASWLEPVPVPNLVNQYPVELRSVESKSSMGRRVPGEARREQVPDNGWQQRRNHAGLGVMDENKSAWSTNWMSASTETQGPQPPPKVTSRSDLPSRQSRGPQIPPKVPHEENPHQEVLNFLPGATQQPQPLGPDDGDAKTAFSTAKVTKMRHTSIPLDPQLDHFPSILRPGPRRSSHQSPPPTTAIPDTQSSSKPPLPTPNPAMSRVAHTATHFKAYQPPRPHKMAPTVARAHSQSVVERRAPGQVCDDEVLLMPNPDDHVRALRLPRNSTHQTIEPPSTLSQPAALSLSAKGSRPPQLRDVAPARHAAEPTSHRVFMPEPSDHVRMPAELSPNGVNIPQ